MSSAGALFALAPTGMAETYQNREYGFSINSSSHKSFCRSEPDQHDHGVTVYLDSPQKGCNSVGVRPNISVYADYNAQFYRSANEAAKLLCGEAKNDPSLGQNSLRIDHRDSATCRVTHSNSWIEIYVVAQGGRWPEKFDGPEDATAYVTYIVTLQTKMDRYKADIDQLKSLLAAIRIHSPGK